MEFRFGAQTSVCRGRPVNFCNTNRILASHPKPRSIVQRPLRPRTVALALAASVLALFGGLWLALAWIDATFDRAPDPLESVPIAGVQRWGFNLDPLLVPRADLAASPARKDDIPALSDPEAVAASAADWIEADEHVIGVTLGGQSRAWPLRFLAWHRIVNDTLAGEPIAVTWHPLTASAAVFSRHVGGETLQFGVSGLLYKQNLVFFDRRADPNRESLWSQVRRQAIGGPAAGRRLDLIDCDLLPWAAWLRLHPDTTVLSPRTHYPIQYVATWMYWPPPFIPPPDIVADQSVSRLPAAPAKQAERGRRRDLVWHAPVVVLVGPRSMRACPFDDVPAAANGRLDEIPYRLLKSPGAAPGIELQTTGPLKRFYLNWALWTAVE